MEAIRQAQELHRATIEETYTGKCTVRERRKQTKANGATRFEEAVVLKDVPCRLIYKSAVPAAVPSPASALTQSIKLLLAPEINVSVGSRITVAQNGMTEDYSLSGVSAVYATHQEISLELFRGYA